MLEILLIGLIIFCLFALTWELIPDGFKKYWYYCRELRKDRNKKRRRKYIISFR